ncbi:MAG: carbamoyl-phosphate synthase large subunit, partial [Saprospiraceae bacterium]
NKLGLQMKSVGEVMAIGRCFQEALQKACQSLENGRTGLGADKKEWIKTQDILDRLKNAGDDRIFRLKDAMVLGVPTNTIHNLTKIDPWYLQQIKELIDLEKQLARIPVPDDISYDFMLLMKQKGYSDAQMAWLMRIEEHDITKRRLELGLRRSYKMVDTCAAEFEAQTPYFYSTYEDENESIPSNKKKIIVLGSGPNRIGQGIEFDYCCVHGLLALKEAGYESIMINCNPETVSTDFDVADKLYFEPVFWEHLEEIIHLEKPEGVIVQLGGQTALKLAEKLDKNGIKIIGTSYKSMDLAEDRGAFSDLLKELEIPYPEYGVADTAEKAIAIAERVSFPVLVRPSYVLGGQRMKIVINNDELERQVLEIFKHMPDNKVLIDQFLERAKEAEVDAICDGEDVMIMGIMEHIEPAGIHSGDSSAVLPTYSLSDEVVATMKAYTKKLALALGIKGLINIQFAISPTKDGNPEQVYVIEANPRASRTTPFIAKAYQVPFLNMATKVMLGTHKIKDFNVQKKLEGYAIKYPVFSFDKFPNVDKQLGPEMKSTGEGIRFIKDLKDPYFRELERNRNMYLYN